MRPQLLKIARSVLERRDRLFRQSKARIPDPVKSHGCPRRKEHASGYIIIISAFGVTV